jgi:uncharacterized membrane-anchored protein
MTSKAKGLGKLLSKQTLRKVPEVTFYFWIIKLLTTAMGESTSDYFVQAIDPVIAVLISGVLLLVILLIQLWIRRYVTWIYWLTVVMVAIFGTMAADILHVGLRVPYSISATFFAIILAVVFFFWYSIEKSLSIHSITNRRRELFYWATVMATFALGTAAGDLTASTLNLGYLPSAFLFGVLFLLPAIAYKFFGLNEIFSFWFAYIMTRPLGASFADWFGKPSLGGLGLGDEKVSIVLSIFIIIFVSYLAVIEKNKKTS